MKRLILLLATAILMTGMLCPSSYADRGNHRGYYRGYHEGYNRPWRGPGWGYGAPVYAPYDYVAPPYYGNGLGYPYGYPRRGVNVRIF